MLLHFVFCLSPCRVNICYLNECCLPVFEVLHFTAFWITEGEFEVTKMAWSSQQPLGPQGGLGQRRILPRMHPTTPVLTALSVSIFIPVLLLKFTSIHSKRFLLYASLLQALLGLRSTQVNQYSMWQKWLHSRRAHFSISRVSCQITGPSIHCD